MTIASCRSTILPRAVALDHCDVIHTYERDEREKRCWKLAEATGGRMLEVRGMDKPTTALTKSQTTHHQYSLGIIGEPELMENLKIQIAPQEQGYKVYARSIRAHRVSGNAVESGSQNLC